MCGCTHVHTCTHAAHTDADTDTHRDTWEDDFECHSSGAFHCLFATGSFTGLGLWQIGQAGWRVSRNPPVSILQHKECRATMSHNPSWWEQHGGRNTRQLVTLPPLDAEGGEYWCSAHYFFIQSGTPTLGMMLSIFRMVFPNQLA